MAALQDSFGKSAHSELAAFALYWLVVTFPFGIVHILVMIRLRVVCGGRWVGQVLPSYQNRQISALDETADAPQSSLSALLSVLSVTMTMITRPVGPLRKQSSDLPQFQSAWASVHSLFGCCVRIMQETTGLV